MLHVISLRIIIKIIKNTKGRKETPSGTSCLKQQGPRVEFNTNNTPGK
jgi:hypothetical protein